ncbi:peptidylprolyl isomerase [Schinkia sp. CFF1]
MQTYDQPPILENSRTLVPLRGVFESLGATVQWDSTKQEITAVKGEKTIWLKIGSKVSKVNGTENEIDVPALIKNSRTMIPLRFVGEALGANVKWISEKGVVQITMDLSQQEVLPQFAQVQSGEPTVTMKTSKGEIKFKLFPAYAPKAVENFLKLSQNSYYNGLTFHRVIDDFMIQGGDPTGNGTGGASIWGTPFADEFSPQLAHFRGALSMANSGPNTNGSQFFIVQAKSIDESLISEMEKAGFNQNIIEKYKSVGGTPWLDNHYTVFGQVIEGLDIVDQIATVDTDDLDKPVTPIYIEKVIVQQ